MNSTPSNLATLRETASRLHANAGQTYGELPYVTHLDAVAEVLIRFGYTAASHPHLQEAAYGHDLKEDVHISDYYLGVHGFSPEAIILIEKVTDEPGANRKERKLKTYPKTASHPDAIILKLADRIANVESGGKVDMYRKEQEIFAHHLREANPKAEPMWEHLDGLLTPTPDLA